MRRLLALTTIAALLMPSAVGAIGLHGGIGRGGRSIGPHSGLDQIVPEPRYLPSIQLIPDGPGDGDTGSPQAIPEPGTVLLVAVGLAGASLVRRRRS